MQLNTVLKLKDADLPPLETDQTRLVIAAGGIYREWNTAMFSSSTRVELADLGLADHWQFCHLDCGKLSRVMHRAMLSFFRYANELHGGEAALVLLYHPERQRFRWHCPLQTVEMYWSLSKWVAGDCIAFSHPTTLPEGYVHFGDAHLHVGSSAVPSLTDVRDDQDGMHIIVANVQSEPRYHVDFVVDGKRFGVSPELVFEAPDCLPGPHPPRRWIDRVQVRRYVLYQSHDAWVGDQADNSRDDDWPDTRARRNPRNGDYDA
jgi:hypothetical protein